MKAELVRKIIPEMVLKSFLGRTEITDFTGDISVAAVDIGYGFVKYVSGVDDQGNIQTNLFPSLAVLSPQENLVGDFFVKRNTIKIENGGTVWEAGPDINQLATQNDVRALHDSFVTSEQWKVLFLAALAYINIPTIDILVLGLPVSGMSKKEFVEKAAKGTHHVNGMTIEVKNVLVIPQPLGALYNHAIKSSDFNRFMSTSTLVIDPGYLTFDFLVTKGFSVNAHRSGARPGSMASILSKIAESISKYLGHTYDDLSGIDEVLSSKDHDPTKGPRTINIYGEELELTEHIKQTKSVIESSLHYLLNKIGDSKDIAQIIIAGGPNFIFEKSVSASFPHHCKNGKISSMDDGILSNVIGYYLWGLMIAYGQVTEN